MEENKMPKGNPPQEPWDARKDVEHWKSEYKRLMNHLENMNPEEDMYKELACFQESEVPPEVKNRRSEPRYNFQFAEGGEIFIHMGAKSFKIVNISVGGVAFYSDVFFTKGTRLLLSALGMIALDVEVLHCTLEEKDDLFMDYHYIVRAKFDERVNGYQVYMLAREMYLKSLKMLIGEVAG